MRKWMFLLSLLMFLFSSQVIAAGKVIILNVDGPIGPAMQDYIERGIATAEKIRAEVIILKLDTPGGLDTSMRNIDEAIIKSSVPVIAYVTPSGARAASAGVFILYASHLAAMTPGTNVGAASPVNLSGATKAANAKNLTAEEMKTINDAAAYIKSLAELRGRNATWAEDAVRQALSVSASEAKRLNIINEIANNDTELLQKIDKHSVKVQDKTITLNTQNLESQTITPDWRYQFLQFLTNPNIAYILMLIAIYGLFFELSNPGLILPGIAGIISLLLVLYAFQLMPVNYVGLSLVLLGFACMLFEIYISSFGVIGLGGLIAFIIGSIMLFDSHDGSFAITWPLLLMMSIISIIFFFMIMMLAFRSHKKAIVTGSEGLIGSEGVVLSVMNEQIAVRVLGEIWEAKSNASLNPGQKIKVTQVHGLVLNVVPLEKSGD